MPRALGPELHLIAAFPEPGAGLDCPLDAQDGGDGGDAGACGVPLDSPLELRFDRPLLPRTAALSSVALYPQGTRGTLFLEPEYDVIERVVTYRLRGGGQLAPGLLYEVDVRAPDAPEASGFRAYDGAPLAVAGSTFLHYSFRTALAAPPPPPATAPPPTCADFERTLSRGTCLDCHSVGLDPPMGLRLGSADDLRRTAIGRVAHETDQGPVGGRVLVDPPRFGVGMAIIAPGDPANSYMLYKVLANPGTYLPGGCTSVHQVALPAGQCLAPSAEEQQRMRQWFLRLDPMPPPGNDGLDLEGARLLQDYVRAGAPLDGCP